MDKKVENKTVLTAILVGVLFLFAGGQVKAQDDSESMSPMAEEVISEDMEEMDDSSVSPVNMPAEGEDFAEDNPEDM